MLSHKYKVDHFGSLPRERSCGDIQHALTWTHFMVRWVQEQEIQPEVRDWIIEHGKGQWAFHPYPGIGYIEAHFELEEDAMLFKLTWL